MKHHAKLQAYVFCDCYEQGCLKRLPPNPEIVVVLPNGDLGYSEATKEQHAAFIAWRTHACRHPEGVVTGGELGNRLPLKVLHEALSKHAGKFPILLRKILGGKRHTRASHITIKQVEKLQLEVARLKAFRCVDRRTDREIRWFCGQMNQLVRAALKYRRPIAI